MKTTPLPIMTQTARTCICIRHAGKLRKLAWINEDSQGVYVGTYGAHAGMHFSYHIDGTTHFKGPAGQLLTESTSMRPIASIDKMEQLGVLAVPLHHEEAVEKNTHVFEGDSNAFSVFIGGEEVESSVLNVTEYIVHRSAEAEFARKMYEGYSRADVKLVGFAILPLTNFPSHKVALLISALSPAA